MVDPPTSLPPQFTGAVTIDTICLLAHELYVPSKVHFSVGKVPQYSPPDHRNAKYSYLGSLRFHDNKEWRLREQQTIEINGAAGSFLKLSVDSPHAHAKNLCGQVGLVNVAVEGQLDLSDSTKVHLHMHALKILLLRRKFNHSACPQVLMAGREGLNFTMLTHGIDLDKEYVHAEARVEGMGADALHMVRRVVVLKQRAEAAEDFDEAQRLVDGWSRDLTWSSGVLMRVCGLCLRIEDTAEQY